MAASWRQLAAAEFWMGKLATHYDVYFLGEHFTDRPAELAGERMGRLAVIWMARLERIAVVRKPMNPLQASAGVPGGSSKARRQPQGGGSSLWLHRERKVRDDD